MKSSQVAVYGRVKFCPQNLLSQDFDLKFNRENQIMFLSCDKNLPKRKSFRFKKLFEANATQDVIFDTVARPVINEVLSGYNALIFTFGQLGSGKTYTMTGDMGKWGSYGLIPRTIQEIFRVKKNSVIKITYCEIQNEHVYDLIGHINSEPDGTKVSQLKNSKISMFRDLSVHRVQTASDALQLFFKGNEKKMRAETDEGSFTSRSHIIYSISFELPCTEDGILHLNPILYLVDLASVDNRENFASNPLEMRNTTLSLLYLEHVLLALRRPRTVVLPYRNSRITSFLKNTLGGNFITAAIATLSLSTNEIEQTIQTCQFAERLKQITSIVYPTEIIIPSKKIFNPSKDIELLEKQYKYLKAQLGVFLNNQLPEEELEKDEKEKCAALVEKFISGCDIFDLLDCDIRKTVYCFHLMRGVILQKEASLDTSVKLEFSDLSFMSNNEFLLEASKPILEHTHTEKDPDYRNFAEIQAKEWQGQGLVKGNENNSTEKEDNYDIKESELDMLEVVHQKSDSTLQKPIEEYVLVQNKIADRSELVLCIMKSGEKESLSSQTSLLFDV